MFGRVRVTRRLSRPLARVTRAVSAPTVVGGEANVGTLVHDGDATPEQISLFLPLTGVVATTATATCRYRVAAGTWVTGHPLHRIRTAFSLTPGNGGAVEDGFAWPIIDLLPGTAYEVEVTVTDGAAVSVRTLNHTTRALPAAAGAATINVTAGSSAATIAAAINGASPGDVVELADGTYNLTGSIDITASGSSGSPIHVRGASRDGVILARSTVGEFFTLDANLSDLVIENMTIEGNGVDQDGNVATSYTTVLGQTSANLQGTLLATRVTLRNITATGIDRGVYVYRCEQLLVYDNSFTGNNLWQTTPTNFLDSNRTWNDDGALVAGVGNCVFNNFLKGFGDTCSCVQDDGTHGRAQHFYRNDIRNSCDDVLEVDDGRRNITFYDNRVTNCIDFDSLDPLYGGPAIIARNVYINPARSYPHKWNSQNTGHFLYNNTYISTVSAVGFDQDVSAWYQTNNGAQRSYGYRNNVHVYRGAGISLWMDASTNDPMDWTHNSWFPNRDFQFQGSSYASLAAIQSGISNRTPIFAGTNRPFENDNITVTNPWTTTITLGANALTEVTASYTPVMSGGSAPKNSGVAIANITDGFSGASPDRGAVIEGRTQPFYGDRTSLPTWVQALAVGEWTSLANTLWSSVQYSPVPPGNGPENKALAWNSLVVDPITSRAYNVAAGGHNDYAGNEVEYLDLNKETPNWVRALDPSPAGQYANPGTGASYYSDGRPCSRHSYHGITYDPTARRIFLFGGYPWDQNGNAHSAISSYNLDSNTYSSSGAHGSWSTGGLVEPACAADPATGDVYVLHNFVLGRWRPSTNTWTTDLAPSGSVPHGQYACSAFDTTRGRAFFLGGASAINHTYTVGTNTVAAVTLSGAAAGSVKGSERGMVYVPDIDAYLVRAAGAGQTVYRIDASTFVCTTLSVSGGSPPATSNGPYNKFLYVPALRGCIYVPTYSGNCYFLRVH